MSTDSQTLYSRADQQMPVNNGIGQKPESVAYARPGAARGRARARSAVISAAAALVVILIAALVPVIRSRALASKQFGGMGGSSMDNLRFTWVDHYGEGGFRGMLSPHYSNPTPKWPDYGNANVESANPTWHRGELIDPAGRRLVFPRGRNLAVVAPDGTVNFINVPPEYFIYDNYESFTQSWGFTARKKKVRGLNVEKMREDGLLPDWARVQSLLPKAAKRGHF